jgi:hypothetical protein
MDTIIYYKFDSTFPMTDDDTYFDIDDGLDFEGIKSWALGAYFTAIPPNPIMVSITRIGESKDPNLIPIPFNDANMCLASPEVVNALKSVGVDNIQIFPAILKDSDTNKEYFYFALNIIGVQKVSDLSASEWTNFDDEARMDTIFESLLIDEKKVVDANIFRLHEDMGTIIISEALKRSLEKIPYLTFTPVSK